MTKRRRAAEAIHALGGPAPPPSVWVRLLDDWYRESWFFWTSTILIGLVISALTLPHR